KPTIQFSGVNVQIVNGEGKEEAMNGAGNLVVGYDEFPGEQTGSHNLVLGRAQTYKGVGSFLAGSGNTASGFLVRRRFRQHGQRRVLLRERWFRQHRQRPRILSQ